MIDYSHVRSDFSPRGITVRYLCESCLVTQTSILQRVYSYRCESDTLPHRAYDVYKSPSDVEQRGHFGAGVDLPAKYRSIFGISREVEVHFIGVW